MLLGPQSHLNLGALRNSWRTLIVTVPSSRWVGCGFRGDTFNSPILSPPPCLQALLTSLALSGVVGGQRGWGADPGQWLKEELDTCVSGILATVREQARGLDL